MVFVDPRTPRTRDLWSRYTIEFARRGLALLDGLELYGPDPAPNDRVWGQARARTRTRERLELRFVGLRGCVDPCDVRGLRVSWRDGWREVHFPVLPSAKLSEELRQLIRRAQTELLDAGLAKIQRAAGVSPPRALYQT